MSYPSLTCLQDVGHVVLTPTKRRRCPKLSLSPQKPQRPEMKLRTCSENPSKRPEIRSDMGVFNGADLVFSNGYTAWNEKTKEWEFPPSEYMSEIHRYLESHYKIGSFDYCPPFLFIHMELGEKVPESDQRPFRVAGLACIWLTADEPTPPPRPAFDGFGEGEYLTLPDDIAKSFVPGEFPPASTMEFLVATYFPTAHAISFFIDTVIVEFPRTDNTTTAESLPSGFKNCKHTCLRFLYGELAYTQLGQRRITPNTKFLTGDIDDTCYVGDGNPFTPGMRVFNSLGDDKNPNVYEFTSGIFVHKDGKHKVTLAAHAYDDVLMPKDDVLSGSLPLNLFQGNDKQSNKVAALDELIQFNGVRTDIGLASIVPKLEFQNKTFQNDIEIRKLMRLHECKPGNIFLIDSYITGPQKLMLHGIRAAVKKASRATQQFDIKTKGLPPELLPPPDLRYLALWQGMFSTSTSEIPRQPQIRAGVCGSAVIRIQTMADGDVSADGAVAGFMHFADLEPRNDTEGKLICYADVCDALIDQGWSV